MNNDMANYMKYGSFLLMGAGALVLCVLIYVITITGTQFSSQLLLALLISVLVTIVGAVVFNVSRLHQKHNDTMEELDKKKNVFVVR